LAVVGIFFGSTIIDTVDTIQERIYVQLYIPIHQVPTTAVKDTADCLIENRKLTFLRPSSTDNNAECIFHGRGNAGSAMKNEAEN